MPVQFTCSHCRRTLSVARRKAGTPVACPKCGQSTIVPPAEGPLSDINPVVVMPALGDAKPPAEIATAPPATNAPASKLAPPKLPGATASPAPASVPPPAPGPLASEIGAFDDIPALIGDAEPIAVGNVPASAPPFPPAPPPLPADVVNDLRFTESLATTSIAPATARLKQARRAKQADGQVLLITRRAVYAQAGLTAGLLIAAFLAGLLIGRGERPETSSSPATAEPVALSGHVLYALSPGESLPDEGAVVMALPVDDRPDVKLAARGLRPDDDDLDETHDALRAAGGEVARSDAGGQFQLVVPRPGNYRLLVVSRHATRPDATLDTADAKELAKYLAEPGDLIGQKRYALLVRRLTGSPAPFTHEFGPTDKR